MTQSIVISVRTCNASDQSSELIKIKLKESTKIRGDGGIFLTFDSSFEPNSYSSSSVFILPEPLFLSLDLETYMPIYYIDVILVFLECSANSRHRLVSFSEWKAISSVCDTKSILRSVEITNGTRRILLPYLPFDIRNVRQQSRALIYIYM